RSDRDWSSDVCSSDLFIERQRNKVCEPDRWSEYVQRRRFDASSPPSLRQKKLASVWPFVRVANETGANRIVQHIFAFCLSTFERSEERRVGNECWSRV